MRAHMYYVLAFDLPVKCLREAWLPGSDVYRAGKSIRLTPYLGYFELLG
jgi:hypothetical protein